MVREKMILKYFSGIHVYERGPQLVVYNAFFFEYLFVHISKTRAEWPLPWKIHVDTDT